MKALVPVPVDGWFHPLDTQAAEVRLARFFTPEQAMARRALERINQLHAQAARREAQGIDPALLDALIAKVAG